MHLDRKQRIDATLRLLRMHYEAGVGHIGGNLSCLDILMTLHHAVLRAGDCFVLSKGHSAGALYVALWSKGVLTDADLTTFHRDGTLLSGHPPVRGIPGIAFATGSLGHGLGLAAGTALARKLTAQGGRVYCLTSDGEWNEGSSWEALVFIRQRCLENLTVIVDLNGQQGFGPTHEVADLGSLTEKFKAFGLLAVEVDGHNPEELTRVLTGERAGPMAVVARTVKGHGVSFMQNRFEWHYLPLSGEQYREAVRQVELSCDEPSATRS